MECGARVVERRRAEAPKGRAHEAPSVARRTGCGRAPESCSHQSGHEGRVGIAWRGRAQELAAVAQRRNWPAAEALKLPSSEERAPERRSTGAAERRNPVQSSRGERSSAKAAEVRTLSGASVVERPSAQALGKPSRHTEQAPKYSETIFSMRIKQSVHGNNYPCTDTNTQTKMTAYTHSTSQES